MTHATDTRSAPTPAGPVFGSYEPAPGIIDNPEVLSLLGDIQEIAAERDIAVTKLRQLELNLDRRAQQVFDLLADLAAGHLREVDLQEQIRTLSTEAAEAERELVELRGQVSAQACPPARAERRVFLAVAA
jgi:chromosome segregation ATPase